jgi:tyrosyl-tRNA synthetase
VVQRKEIPSDIPGIDLELADRDSIKLFEVLVEAGLAPSKSEARRLVQQGAVSIDGERLSDPTRVLEPGEMLIQVGKRRFARVQIRR